MVSILFGLQSCSFYHVDVIRRDVQEVFKNTQVVDVKKSEIPCLYEVYYNGSYPDLIYYYPDKRLFVFGEIWTLDGQSLTAEKRKAFLEKLEQKDSRGSNNGREKGRDE